jgi:hypothetical protein
MPCGCKQPVVRNPKPTPEVIEPITPTEEEISNIKSIQDED